MIYHDELIPIGQIAVGSSITYYQDGSTLINSSSSYLTTTFHRRKVGFSNPAWRQLVRDRMNASTPFTASSAKILFNDPGYFVAGDYRSTSQLKYQETVMVGGGNLGLYLTSAQTTSFASVDNAAREKFYRKAASSFNAGTFMGELRETVGMIRRPALALRKAANAFRLTNLSTRTRIVNGLRRNASPREIADAQRKYRKAVSDSWLEVQFGWKPFISDIQNFYDLAKAMMELPRIEIISGEHSETENAPLRKRATYTPVGAKFESDVYSVEHFVRSVRYKAGIHSRVSTDMPIMESLGLAPSDWIPTAWELLPYSFLIDYFSNVGNVLNAWAIYHRLRYAWLCKTERSSCSCQVLTVSKLKLPVYDWKQKNEGRLGVSSKYINRSVPSVVPPPSLELRNKLSTNQGLNIAALAHARSEDSHFKPRR